MLITDVEGLLLERFEINCEVEGGVRRVISTYTANADGDECPAESGAARVLYINARYGDEEGYVLSGGLDTDGVTVGDAELASLLDELEGEMKNIEQEAVASGNAAGYFIELARQKDKEAEARLGELQSSISRSMKLGIGLSVLAFLLLLGVIAIAVFS